MRLVALGLGLREAGNSALALRLQRLDLPICQLEGRLRAQKCSLLLMQLRGELLGVLNRAIACVLQVLEALRLLLCEHQCRLRLIHLRLVGADLCLLHVELRIDILDVGLRRRDLRLRLLERRAKVTVIDTGDHVAGFDMLVVGDGDGRDVARDFRCDRKLPRRDEGIIGRFEMSCVVQVEVAAGDRGGEEHGADRGDNGAAT